MPERTVRLVESVREKHCLIRSGKSQRTPPTIIGSLAQGREQHELPGDLAEDSCDYDHDSWTGRRRCPHFPGHGVTHVRWKYFRNLDKCPEYRVAGQPRVLSPLGTGRGRPSSLQVSPKKNQSLPTSLKIFRLEPAWVFVRMPSSCLLGCPIPPDKVICASPL